MTQVVDVLLVSDAERFYCLFTITSAQRCAFGLLWRALSTESCVIGKIGDDFSLRFIEE